MQFRFGDYLLDVARRELRRSGELIALEPQVFDLLVCLIGNRDRIVTKEDLLDTVWGGRSVSESTLTSRINAARRAVGDSGDEQRLIRTSPRKGIRFVGDVTESEPTERMLLHTPQDRPSIAVLPFDNLSGDQEQDYFADGMVAEIITGLSRIKWLFVISRNSTFTYKGKPVDIRKVAVDLGVRYVLEGSVRRAANRVRIAGQLVEGATGNHVWAEKFEGSVADIFDLQDRLTESIVGVLEPTLRRAEVARARGKRHEMLGAYDLYLRALPHGFDNTIPENDEAIRLLAEAIRLDPDYAVAHAHVAWCHEQRWYGSGFHNEDRVAALEHAARAIALGTDDPEALCIGAFVQASITHEYEGALSALSRALEMNPNSALAFGFSAILLAIVERYDLATEHAMKALRLSPNDPLSYHPQFALSMVYLFTERFEEAVDFATRATQAKPTFQAPHTILVTALVRLNRIEAAQAAGRRLMKFVPGFTISGYARGEFLRPSLMDILAVGLRQAGLPE